MSRVDDADIIERLTRFCRRLRDHGLTVTPAESIDAARALRWIDLDDRTDLRLALRTLFATRRDDLAIFDELFREWWNASPHSAVQATPEPRSAPQPSVPGTPKANHDHTAALSRWAALVEGVDEEPLGGLAAPSAREARAARDFASFGAGELEEIQRVTRQIARRLNARKSRRWKPAHAGQSARVDLRRTMRLSLKTGGDAIELARRERRLRRTKLVALCDVSGSMDLYSRFLLQFLYALQHAFARVETFVFSTRLVRITDALARDEYRSALDALKVTETGWSGGTRIGESVAAFVAAWPGLIDRRSVVIVLSDGWDTGAPEVLGEAMHSIQRRAGRVVWLNPLLGSPSYKPLTRGMQAALPHVDVFAPVHNLASLEALGRHLAL